MGRVNVAEQRRDPASLLSLYRRLIRVRRDSAALRGGTYRAIDVPAGTGLLAFLREAPDDRRLVVVECDGRDARADLAGMARGRLPDRGHVAIGTESDRDGAAVDLRSLELRPNEGLIVRI